MNKKKKYKIFLIVLYISIFVFFSVLFGYYYDLLYPEVISIDGLLLVSLIVIIRIIILFFISIYIFYKYFKQEYIYISDAFSLFGLYFLVLMTGKCFDLFTNITYFIDLFNSYTLLLMKIRYFVIIINIIPMLYLGLEFLILVLKEYFTRLDEVNNEKLRFSIITFFFIVISSLIMLINDIKNLTLILPIITFGTAIGIILMFLFMYMNKKLSQANGLIISIGFALYILSSILRGFLAQLAQLKGIFIAELIDMFIYLIIFVGFITKPKYS